MKTKVMSILVLLALLLSACGGPGEASSSSPPQEAPESSSQSSEPASAPSPAQPGKKPLSLARELPDTGEPIELEEDEWDIPPNPRYPNELKVLREEGIWPPGQLPHAERVWWTHGKVLRVTGAEGYQSLEGDPIQWEMEDRSSEEWKRLLEEYPEAQQEGMLYRQLLCDEDGALLCPYPFYYIYLREDYIALTDLDRTFLIDYDGNLVDALSFPVTEAHTMDRLPDGTYRGYLGEIVTTYDETGKVLERDTTAYQVPLPGGMVLDAKGQSRNLAECNIVPYLRGHPDPAVEQWINQTLEDRFALFEYECVFERTFTADYTGDVLHIDGDTWGKSFDAVGSMQSYTHIYLDLRTGESYSYYDLFADEEGAQRLIFEKGRESGVYSFFPETLEDFRETEGYFYISSSDVCYELEKFRKPVRIPLEEFDQYLDRDSRFYQALVRQPQS